MGDEFKNLPGLSIKNIFGNPSLADVDNDFFNKNANSNFSSERLDHFSLAKSAQHEVQTNKKTNKQTEYQNLKV